MLHTFDRPFEVHSTHIRAFCSPCFQETSLCNALWLTIHRHSTYKGPMQGEDLPHMMLCVCLHHHKIDHLLVTTNKSAKQQLYCTGVRSCRFTSE